MSRTNENSDNGRVGFLEQPEVPGILDEVTTTPPSADLSRDFATRSKQRAKLQIHQNRFVIVAGGAIVTALLIFVAVSMPHRSGGPQKAKNRGVNKGESTAETINESEDKSLFPITDSGRPAGKEVHQGFLNERDLQRTVTRSGSGPSQTAQTNTAGTLGSIPPFGDNWQPPPYAAASRPEATDLNKVEREAMEKPSLMYVRKISVNPTGTQTASDVTPELGMGLATGTRLRARLDSSPSTAVRAPVLAVIEYNYEEGGEIIIPAGAKAIGHFRTANRSGYVDLQFDSLLMPDGTSLPIEAAATGLDLRPLKGRVEAKNTGKNVLVRSLSGIGQAGSLFLGRGSLNKPLSQSDLMRERLSSNIGEAGDEELSRLAVNQQIVVTVSAGTPIYVVLEQTPKSHQSSTQTSPRNNPSANSANVDQLRQLLQLQQELNQSSANNASAQ